MYLSFSEFGMLVSLTTVSSWRRSRSKTEEFGFKMRKNSNSVSNKLKKIITLVLSHRSHLISVLGVVVQRGGHLDVGGVGVVLYDLEVFKLFDKVIDVTVSSEAKVQGVLCLVRSSLKAVDRGSHWTVLKIGNKK